MVFSSLVFLCLFFPLFLGAYFLLPRLRIITLVIFSFVFYAFGEPVWVLALLLSGAVNYFMALLIAKTRETAACRTVFIISIVFNLGMLCAFKYTGFIVENANALSGLQVPVPGITLPIGISFYTFQAMSYIIDIYRNKVEAQRSLMKFMSYFTMFPQLVAGPIVRYSDIQESLRKPEVNIETLARESPDLSQGLARRCFWRIRPEGLSITCSTWTRILPFWDAGSDRCSSRFRSTSISPDIPIWQSGSGA